MSVITQEKINAIYGPVLGQDDIQLPEKKSSRKFFIRRALEDRLERQELECLLEDKYWNEL
ncbi:MAG: hypothetical protein OXC07_11535 [Kistimonas sp.]|nr:hypothetical protein [Kistimonas sp.]